MCPLLPQALPAHVVLDPFEQAVDAGEALLRRMPTVAGRFAGGAWLGRTPAALDAALASGDEWLDGKSVTAWYRAKQVLGL